MTRIIRSGWILVVMLLALGLPSSALACPVCIDPSAASRSAYLNTTILLSLLPLGFIFGVGMLLRARLRALDENDGYSLASPAHLRQETP